MEKYVQIHAKKKTFQRTLAWLFYTKKEGGALNKKYQKKLRHFIKGQGAIHQKFIKIATIYIPNNRVSKLTKQTLTEMRGEINQSSVMLEDFNELFSVLDGSSRKRNSKETEDLNTISHLHS